MQRIGGSAAPGSFVDQMSGDSIIDLAYDDLLNVGAVAGQTTIYAPNFSQTPYFHSGKHVVKNNQGVIQFASAPRLLFVALSDVGNVDVFEISTGTRIATVSVPGVRVVSNYWRQ